MPQYELMYLLGSQVADDQVPAISLQIKKFITEFGGGDVRETLLGKKKLAYPIGKTRNGHYVVVDFQMDGKNVNQLDAKIRTQDNNIIRYILINQDEHLARLEKDKVVQAKLNRRIPPEAGSSGAPTQPTEKKVKKPAVVLDLAPEDIDAKIEKALSEDITK
jgi:small subunit ribosomal protein S6